MVNRVWVHPSQLVLIKEGRRHLPTYVIGKKKVHFFLGLQVSPLSDGLFISQSKYVLDLLKHFKMDNCKAYATPFQLGIKLTKDCESSKTDTNLYHWLISSLIYLSHSRLGISFDVSVVSRFMQDPRERH